MIVISDSIQLHPIALSDQKVLFKLMSRIYPPAYAHLWDDDGQWYLNELYTSNSLAKELSEKNAPYHFIVFGGERIGILRYVVNEALPGNSTKNAFKLHRIYIAKETQGKGIAQSILSWLEGVAKTQNAPLIWLDVMDTQEQALRFYEKMGYVKSGTRRLTFTRLHQHLQGMFYMKKELEISEEDYWTRRYKEAATGWDIGSPSTPIKEYIDQLKNKDLKILIPGAGNAYEAEYLHVNGFRNVYVLDISDIPLKNLQKRVPNFPKQHLIRDNFFEHQGTYDLILEQTFFCSLEPTAENRHGYVKKMSELLEPSGKLVGLWFTHPLQLDGKRPFGGSRQEYVSYLKPTFEIQTFEACYNSIKARKGNELFGIFKV